MAEEPNIEPLISTSSQNRRQGRGRGYLITLAKQRSISVGSNLLPSINVTSEEIISSSEGSNLFPSKNVSSEEIKSGSVGFNILPIENVISEEIKNSSVGSDLLPSKNSSSEEVKTGSVGFNLLPLKNVLPREIKSNFIHFDEKPIKSTYIPPEPDQNDESIYNTGMITGEYFNEFNNIDVKVSGKDRPSSIESFETCDIPKNLMENLQKCKFIQPTPIQKNTIPIILSGRDLMAAAQTGSGKTVAFVLPIIQKLIMDPRPLVKDSNHSEPQVVIMAPTRELAVQIKIVVLKLTRGTGISSLVCYGGTLVIRQKKQILEGCHILVATPGRLNEFVQHGFVTFESVRFFVLDEVDKMLDFDSKLDIDKIVDHSSMPSVMNRQTIMVSATLPDSIQQLGTLYLNKNYLFLAVGVISSASKDIQQKFHLVPRFKKRQLLLKILSQGSEGTIVFVNQKWTADFLATYLCEKQISSTSIHGDRLQDKREEALNEFTSGKRNVLVATTVASRGLDIKCVKHVINYDMPDEIEEYIQRIGRTGRLGNQGIATSFFDDKKDSHLVEPIVKILVSANQKIPHWLPTHKQQTIDEKSDDFDQFGSTDFRTKSNIDDFETW